MGVASTPRFARLSILLQNLASETPKIDLLLDCRINDVSIGTTALSEAGGDGSVSMVDL